MILVCKKSCDRTLPSRCYPIRKPKAELMEMSAYISEEFKITNIKVANFAEIHPLKMRIVGLNQKFL
jgi:hypothetical protein